MSGTLMDSSKVEKVIANASSRIGTRSKLDKSEGSGSWHPFGSWHPLGQKMRVHWALLTVQLGYGGYYVLTKAAMGDGVNRVVFAVYRDCIGLVLMAPLAYFSERQLRPSISFLACVYMIALGVIGIFLQQTLFLAGLSFTSTAFAASMQNAIPVFTFLIAVLCRNEVIRLKKMDGIAKLAGILACVAGAVTMSLYKGPTLLGKEPVSSPSPAGSGSEAMPVHHVLQAIFPMASDGGDLSSHLLRYKPQLWRLGSLCLVMNCFCMGAYTNLQIPALKIYPAPASLTAGSILVGTSALLVTGLATVSDKSKWMLTRPGNIASVVYAGAIASGLNFTLQTWANQRGGPILVAVYIPLQTVFSVILGLVVLNEPLYLGSLIGSLCILTGLYFVIWGQQAHRRALQKEAQNVMFSHHDDIKRPLLSYLSS